MNQNRNGQPIYISPDGWFSLAFPEDWEFEENADCTTFWRGFDGIGALQISAYKSARPESAVENLAEYLTEEKVDVPVTDSLIDDQQVAMAQFTTEDSFTRVLFITKGTYVVFVTYLCDLASTTIEASEVESIIKSIRLTE